MSDPKPFPAKPAPLDKPLPPVEPPSPGFLIQLFVVPMLIVTIIVMVWLMFSWLAHMGSNPRELVRDLRSPNEASWQKALTLADLLNNREHEALKSDVGLATELAQVLDAQLEQPQFDEASLRLRMFLCRALGEFHVPAVLPTILKAASLEREPDELAVRRSALQALAVYAENNGSEELRANAACLQVLTDAARERTQVSEEVQARADIRSTAAYVLGVIGGDQATERLVLLLDDPYTNTRYNAAVGLCRHGDPRAIPVLLEMLDPANPDAARDEEYDSGRDWKRLQVINTGIRGAEQLAARVSREELQPVTDALQRLVDSQLDSFGAGVRRGIRLQAEDALLTMTSDPK